MVLRITETDSDHLETVVGSTRTHLNRYTILESTMDNLLLQAVMDTGDFDLAFSNGWRYGALCRQGISELMISGTSYL